MARMKKNVTLFTPDGKTTHYVNVQEDHIDENGVLTFKNQNGDKTVTTTLPFTLTEIR
jgi:hypothetical protein